MSLPFVFPADERFWLSLFWVSVTLFAFEEFSFPVSFRFFLKPGNDSDRLLFEMLDLAAFSFPGTTFVSLEALLSDGFPFGSLWGPSLPKLLVFAFGSSAASLE